jgi:ABC-2 type transport system permease protein
MGPLTGLLWRQHASRGRLLAIGALGAIVVLLGVAILVGDGSVRAARGLVEEAGFALLVPVTAVVLGTSVLGDPAEDGTLGFLLTTPRPRWRLALPAQVAATATVVPLTVVPLVAVLVLNGADATTTVAVAVASALAGAAYAGLFTALGLRFRRALLAGLFYVAVWEGVVARFGTGLARLSVRQYALSVVAGIRGRTPPTGGVEAVTAVVVLVGLVVVGGLLTTRLLRTHESRA